MQRSKFDIRVADAGAGGMSINSGSGGASGMGASSSPSVARKRCHPVVHALFSSHKSVAARDALSAEDWRRHALFMARPSKEPSRTERARVALACVWMQLLLRKTATSQGCKYDVLRGGMKHSTTCGKGARMAASVASLAWMLAMSQRRIHVCPSLPGLSTLSREAASCKIVVVVAQPFSDVTWRAAPARRRLPCQRARPAPACPAGHGPC